MQYEWLEDWIDFVGFYLEIMIQHEQRQASPYSQPNSPKPNPELGQNYGKYAMN